MNEIVEKISSYNLFNYLFPGAVFVFLCQNWLRIDLDSESIILSVFVYYFSGMVVSRIGSLVVEPIMQLIGLISYATYSEYLQAVKVDEKIATLLEQNNVYRTVIALFLTLFALQSVLWIGNHLDLSKSQLIAFVCLSIFILFVFSYRKQSNYIKRRVEIANQNAVKDGNNEG